MIDLATTTKRSLRIDECSEIFGKSVRTIYNWINNGRLVLLPSDQRGCRVDTDSARALAACLTPPGLSSSVQPLHEIAS